MVCFNRPASFGGSARSIQRFHLSARGKTGGTKFSMVISTTLAPVCTATSFLPPPDSNTRPDQSPQCLKFKAIVGSNEAINARQQTIPVCNGRRSIHPSEGKTARNHGSNNGRSLVLALVIIAAARIEAKKSRGIRECFARKAKSTAASANTAPNRSLPMLPACSKKPYPVGTIHIQCHATRRRTPSRVKTLNTSPGSSKNEMKLMRNSSRSVFSNAMNGAETHSMPHARVLTRGKMV